MLETRQNTGVLVFSPLVRCLINYESDEAIWLAPEFYLYRYDTNSIKVKEGTERESSGTEFEPSRDVRGSEERFDSGEEVGGERNHPEARGYGESSVAVICLSFVNWKRVVKLQEMFYLKERTLLLDYDPEVRVTLLLRTLIGSTT